MKTSFLIVLCSAATLCTFGQTAFRGGGHLLIKRAISQPAETGFVPTRTSPTGAGAFLQVSILPRLFLGPFVQFSSVRLDEHAYRNVLDAAYDVDNYYLDYDLSGYETEPGISVVGAQLSYVLSFNRFEIVPIIRAGAGFVHMEPVWIDRKRKFSNYTDKIHIPSYSGVSFNPAAGVQLGYRIPKGRGTHLSLGINCSHFSHTFMAEDSREDIFGIKSSHRAYERRQQFTYFQAEIGIFHAFPLKRPKKD